MRAGKQVAYRWKYSSASSSTSVNSFVDPIAACLVEGADRDPGMRSSAVSLMVASGKPTKVTSAAAVLSISAEASGSGTAGGDLDLRSLRRDRSFIGIGLGGGGGFGPMSGCGASILMLSRFSIAPAFVEGFIEDCFCFGLCFGGKAPCILWTRSIVEAGPDCCSSVSDHTGTGLALVIT